MDLSIYRAELFKEKHVSDEGVFPLLPTERS